MESLALWDRLYDAPEDGRVWADFRTHYIGPVYNWSLKRVKSAAAAEDVTAAVFAKLYVRVRNTRTGRVRPGDAGSYRPYVYAVVRTAVVDYYESVGDSEADRRRVPAADLANLIDPASLNDLEQGIRDYAEYEAALNDYAAAYRSAVRELRAGSHFDAQGLAVFFRVYGSHAEGVAAAIDREFGWSRGMASKHVARTRDRLLPLMGLPLRDGHGQLVPRSADILKLMVLRHGDPP